MEVSTRGMWSDIGQWVGDVVRCRSSGRSS